MPLLLDVVQSSEGTQCLSKWYWELLVKLAISDPGRPKLGDTDALNIAKTLIDAEEWGKLECWIGFLWTFPESAGITEEELENLTLLLSLRQPGAPQRLEQWMEEWNQQLLSRRAPQSFQRILARVHEEAQRQDAP